MPTQFQEPPIILTSDEDLNDQDKTVSVPSGKTWEILTIRAEYVAAAATTTAVTRSLFIDVRDGDDDIIFSFPIQNKTVVGGQTRIFQFYVGAATVQPAGALTPGSQELPENLLLPGGYDIRIYQSGAAATTIAADDMTVHVLAKEFG